MKLKQIPVNQLIEAAYNPRSINKENYEGLKNSITKFGLVEPIVVNNDLTIIDGHMRVRVCKDLNIKEIPCNVINVEEITAKKLNIALNSKEIQGTFDQAKLTELIKEMRLDIDYVSLNINKLDLVKSSKIADLSEIEEWKGLPSFDESDDKFSVIIEFDDEMLLENYLAANLLEITTRRNNVFIVNYDGYERRDVKNINIE